MVSPGSRWICQLKELPDAARIRQADGRAQDANPRQDPFTKRGRLHVLAIGMDRANRPIQVDELTKVALADRPPDARALFPIRDRFKDFFYTPLPFKIRDSDQLVLKTSRTGS